MTSTATNNDNNDDATKGATLLLIDVQNDFHPGGSLAIPTAHDDAKRIAALLRQSLTRSSGSSVPHFERIVATMDSHHKLHIAHPHFWISGTDSTKHPDPFTIISSQDVESGKWKPRANLKLGTETCLDPTVFKGDVIPAQNSGKALDLTTYCVQYTLRLEQKKRFQLCIWPEHCLIGAPGHCIVPVVHEALQEWSAATGNTVEYCYKGQNLLTEMYSALAAEVPNSKETSFNHSLFQSLVEGDAPIYVAGQAMSHCVNYTVRDLVERWPAEGDKSRIHLLTDCASAVPGFEAPANEFVNDMKEAGVVLCTSTSLLEDNA